MISTRSSTRTERLARAALVCGALACVPAASQAQSNAAQAESLFREGKKLMAAKDFDGACPKFAESARLDPSSGVQLALGLCYEGQGRTASAWGAYVTAASLARRDGRKDRESAAQEHASALEPRLPHLTIAVAPEARSLPGLEVREDGAIMGSAAWGDGPVDPGAHILEATAPGKKAFSTKFSIDPGEKKTVRVPALEDEPQSAPSASAAATPITGSTSGSSSAPSTATAPPPETSHTLRNVGLVVGGVGLASTAAGLVLGLVALNKAGNDNKACPEATCANQQAVNDNKTAGTLADASTATFIAGGACVAVGTVLFVLGQRQTKDSSGSTAAVHVEPVMGAAYVGLRGAW